jgi:hypothetical protein
MSDDSPQRSANLKDWLRLQQLLVVRTSRYLQSLADLVGQGSFEPREYIKESANAWAGAVGDLGTWLKPESKLGLPPEQVAVCVCEGYVDRNRGSQEIGITIPTHLFGAQTSLETKVELVLGGLVRRLESPGRPPSVLEPDKHLRIAPNPVTMDELNQLKLRFFDLSGIGESGTFEGLVWAILPGQPAEKKVPATVVTLTLA